MGDLLLTAKDILRMLWRWRWVAVGVAWGLSLVLAVAILFVPNRYEASARIYIDTQTVLKPLMVGLAVQPDVDQRVKMLAQTLISRPNVEQLRASTEIGWEPVDPKRFSREVDTLTDKIRIAPERAENIYLISYRDTDPERATRLVENLVKNFVSSSGVGKRTDSEGARRFIDEQIVDHEKKLESAENALKDYKVKNFSVAGVPAQDYFLRMSGLSDEVNKTRLELSSAEQSRDALKRELASEEPQLPPEAMLTMQLPAAQTETESRLAILNKQLDELLRRYTDAHPDVVSTRRAIAQLEVQKRQEAELRANAPGAKGRGVAATNPVFQKIRISLAEAEANVASLRARLGAQQAQLDQARSVASRAPQAEAELAQLNRDYEIIRKNYELLVSRRESASMGEKIDESSPLVTFRIVDPPRAAPVAPSRAALALWSALAAIAAGLGAAYALSILRPIVDSAKVLREVSGRPVLGSVSLKLSPTAQRMERKRLIALWTSAAALLVLQTAWIGWIASRSLI